MDYLYLGAEKIPVIPRRANAISPGMPDIHNPYYYHIRSAIERFFSQIKENKRPALRFDNPNFLFISWR